MEINNGMPIVTYFVSSLRTAGFMSSYKIYLNYTW